MNSEHSGLRNLLQGSFTVFNFLSQIDNSSMTCKLQADTLGYMTVAHLNARLRLF